MKKEMRAYAKTHNMIILGFGVDPGHMPYGIAIKEEKCIDGKSLFCFGRLYHLWGLDFAFDLCGCNSFEDEKTARMHAYHFFGIK